MRRQLFQPQTFGRMGGLRAETGVPYTGTTGRVDNFLNSPADQRVTVAPAGGETRTIAQRTQPIGLSKSCEPGQLLTVILTPELAVLPPGPVAYENSV